MNDKKTTSDDSTIEAGAERFDAILQQLTTIVERLEGEELDLERSLADFERGMALSRRGQQILDAAERRVEILLRDGTTAPVEPDPRSKD